MELDTLPSNGNAPADAVRVADNWNSRYTSARMWPMIRRAKWIEGIAPEAPVSEVAGRALRVRLEPVAHYLPLAAKRSDKDVEYVHQVRVASRRAVAAIKLFQPLLPARRSRRLRRKLNRIRRACGDARDFDVLIERLSSSPVEDDVGREALVGRIKQCRDAAQVPIRKVRKRLPERRLARRIKQLVARVRWRADTSVCPEPCFGAYARVELRRQLDRFFGFATGDLTQDEPLHRFRIEAKRFRYHLELLAGAFSTPFREQLYPAIEELQERLGQVMDCATASDRYRSWAEQWAGTAEAAFLSAWAASEEAELRTSRAAFLDWWNTERAEALRASFAELLTSAGANGCG